MNQCTYCKYNVNGCPEPNAIPSYAVDLIEKLERENAEMMLALTARSDRENISTSDGKYVSLRTGKPINGRYAP
jgi:hypothetical protein